MMRYEKMLLHVKLVTPDQKIHDVVIRAKSIVELYLKLGYKFGTTLHNAADDLFTLIMHLRVPTNNESERALRQMVIQRKIRQRISTSGGMEGV